jgi:hypothetical protein
MAASLELAGLLGAAVLFGVVGCDAFDSDRKPYTPFPTASGTATPAPAAPQPAPSTEKPLEREATSISRGALVAPADARQWLIAERKLDAPEGLVFRLGLVGGLAGGKDGDVLAWLVGSPEKPVIGELWLYPEQGPPRLVSTAPSFLPTGPTCTHDARLDQTGPNSVSLDVWATCTAPLLPRTAERSVSVLAPLRDTPQIVGFRLAAPAPGETLRIEIVSRDRDADGRDDVEMAVVFGAPGASELRASFVWLDRPAGLSRDAVEPLASFVRMAALDTVHANNHKSSLGVAEDVANARRLYSSLCAESGVARISLDSGAELSCGELGGAFQSLTLANINAELNLGRADRALAALEQHSWFPTGNKVDTQHFIDTQLSQLLPKLVRRRVIKLVPLKAHPRAVESGPHFSPLSFHADGSLLLLTPDGVVRAAPDGRYEYEASKEVDPWLTTVLSKNGEQLTGIAFPCERSEVAWLRSAPDGGTLPPLPTSLVAPRPGACRGGSTFTPPRVAPIAWTEDGVSAFVGTFLSGPLPAHPPLGSALSPNGRFAAVASGWGLLVNGGDKTALWVFDDPALPTQLRDCVISNNAQAAACLLAGRAFVILPDPKTG